MMNYQSFVISDDGTKVVACHRQGFDIYNCRNNKIIARVLYKGYSFGFTDAIFMNDDEIIFIADDQFRYYNISEDREELFIEEKFAYDRIFSATFSEDKKYFAFKSFKSFDSPQYNIKVVDVEAREVIHTLEIDLNLLTLTDDDIGDIVFTKDNKLLVITYAGFMLRYEFGKWNNPEFIKDISVQLDFPLFERRMVSGNIIDVMNDSTIYCEMFGECGLFSLQTGLIERRIPNYEFGGSINISNKKRYIFFAEFHMNYMIYDVHEDRIVHSGRDFLAMNYNNGVGFLDDSHELIGSFNVSIERFDFINNQTTAYFGIDIDNGKLAFSPDNKYLHSYDWGEFKIDIQTGEIVEYQNSSILTYNNSMTQYVYQEYYPSTDKSYLNVYDIEKDEHISLEKFSSGKGNVNPRFSDDDKLLAFSNSSTGKVFVFETENYSMVDSFSFNFSHEFNLSFSPNNQYLSFVESEYNELNENEFLNFRDITNKTFFCENLTTGSVGFKYEFLSNDLIIGLQYNRESCLAISEICSVSKPQVTFCPIHKSDFITNFSITKDKRYCIAGVYGKGVVQYHHLFIYDIINRMHIDSIEGLYWTFTISDDQKYLAAIDNDTRFLYLYELDKVISSVGEEIVEDVSFTLHPNPATEYIEIAVDINPTVNRGVDEVADIKVFNTLGECVMTALTAHPSTGSGSDNLRIDVSTLPRGVYYVRMGNRTQMFVKM
jgi:hypothetical protein